MTCNSWNTTCTAETPKSLYKISAYGTIRGADSMKTEIMTNGPIGCGIQTTDAFMRYTHGIYSEYNLYPSPNH